MTIQFQDKLSMRSVEQGSPWQGRAALMGLAGSSWVF